MQQTKWVVMNVNVTPKERLVRSIHATQNPVNVTANHRFRVAPVKNVKTALSIWLVEIFSVARIVTVMLAVRCIAIVTKKRANVNVMRVSVAEHVTKHLQHTTTQRCIRINLNSKTVTHHPVHKFVTNLTNRSSLASASVATPNSRNYRANY